MLKNVPVSAFLLLDENPTGFVLTRRNMHELTEHAGIDIS